MPRRSNVCVTVDTLVIDKTGTLTLGMPALTDFVPRAFQKMKHSHSSPAWNALSEHPVASAIVEGAEDAWPDHRGRSGHFDAVTGLGVQAESMASACW